MSCDPAAIDDPDVISQPLSLIHVVGSEHDGDPVMTHVLNDIPRLIDASPAANSRPSTLPPPWLAAPSWYSSMNRPRGWIKVDGLLLAAGEASISGARKRGNR
jgi:hypothetical protein